MTRIALIGFGEAAQALARGLGKEGGLDGLTAFDLRFADAAQAPELERRAADSGVRACGSVAEAVAGADVVLSLVVGSAAVAVGEAAGGALRGGQIFVDLNSISPDTKLKVGEALAGGGGGAGFVEGAVMARVPPHLHKVPILLAGGEAERAADLLNALGMSCEAVGDRVGQACAVKMIRSVIVKGVEALLLESLTAAEKAGVRERILDSISETFPGVDWRATATYHIGRTHQHGPRRVTEMEEAAATLRGLGLEPVLSTAIARTIGTSYAKLESSGVPFDSPYPDLLHALAADEGASPVGTAA